MKNLKIIFTTFFVVAIFSICIGSGLIFTNCTTPEVENKPISISPILDREEDDTYDFESLVYATDEELGIENDDDDTDTESDDDDTDTESDDKSIKLEDDIVDPELAIEYIVKIVMPSLINAGTIPADSSLNEKPIVIYDTDGRPEFYEFRILDHAGTQIGTFTTVGKESMGFIEAFQFEYKLDYNPLIEPLAKGNYLEEGKSVRIISDDYPHCAIGIGTVETGRFNTERIFKRDAKEISVEDIMIPIDIETLLGEYRETLIKGDFSEDELRLIAKEYEQNKLEVEEEWRLLNANKGHIEDVIKQRNREKDEGPVILYRCQEFIDSYMPPNTAEKPKNGWCGPTALGWILEYLEYRNLFGTSGTNDYDCDNEATWLLLHQITGVDMNVGILWPWNLQNGVKYFTGNKYTAKKYLFWWSEIKNNIKNRRLPVISLITGWKQQSKDNGSVFKPWHYRDQVGYQVVDGRRKFYIYDLNTVYGPDANGSGDPNTPPPTQKRPYWEYWRVGRHFSWRNVIRN